MEAKMTEPGAPNPVATFETLAPAWQRAMTEKRYHDAITTAFVGYAAERQRDKAGDALEFLAFVEAAIHALGESIRDERLQRSRAEVLCSFCGKGRPEVEVVAGPGVHICVPCAQTVIAATQSPAARQT
jgi:ClpX C4-type zinc finger protein